VTKVIFLHYNKKDMFKNSLIVRDKGFYKIFFTLTAILALQNLITFSVNMADSIMLGRYSEQGLAGVALVNQIQFLLQMLVMGIAEGALVFASRAWGAKDFKTIKNITGISIKTSFVIAFLLGLIVYLFPFQVLGLLSDELPIVGAGVEYMKVIAFSYPIFALSTSLIVSMRSIEKTKIGFYISIMALVSNLILNYMLIFGKFGFAELGVRGAAYATLISRILELIVVLIYVLVFEKTVRFKILDFFKRDAQLFLAFLKRGIPVFLSNAIWGVAMAVQTAILGHMGGVVITANSIAITLFQIISVVAYAGASSSSIIISKTIGEKKNDLIKPYNVTLQLIFVLIGLVTGAILFSLRHLVVSFYIISDQSKDLALAFITVLSITVVGTSYEMSGLTGIVRGGGDTSFVLINDLIFMWLIVIPSSFLAAFYFNASPVVVFILLKSDQILKCIVAAIKLNRYTWIKRLD